MKTNKIRYLLDATPRYTLILTVLICSFIILEPLYPLIRDGLASCGIHLLVKFDFFPKDSEGFVGNFIEWFGVLYGFLLPLILVRAWEQFDAIDREFDKEADTVKTFYEDVNLLGREGIDKKSIFESLLAYVNHVIEHYPKEADDRDLQTQGDNRLKGVREEYFKMANSAFISQKEGEILATELLHQLNAIIDSRGDRIGLCNQRLFESLRFVALIASVIFVVPFYFVKFNQTYGILDSFLVFGVIFLVIFILSTIEDLDEPFYGSWRISSQPWISLRAEISGAINSLPTPAGTA
jgi:hypothetical protein